MHNLVCGVTRSGKSSLAKKICAEYTASGYGTIVFDPIQDMGWDATFVTSNKEEFIRAYFNSQNCRVFVDECSELNRHADKEFEYTATRGRHYGHVNFYLGQRYKHIPRTIRSQCSRVFSFRQSPEDAKELAAEFGNGELRQVSQLERGQYMQATSFDAEIKRLF